MIGEKNLIPETRQEFECLSQLTNINIFYLVKKEIVR